mmetsp:Transcript_7574/g.11245  ORF Transcript_7574/g.11245 Transcript_7574/m.11245 type:complete len:227 (+) Transcript_7574:66-746(+)
MNPPTTQHGVKKHDFSPYANNGGTTLALPGKDFAIAAGDTRLSSGYSIQSRYTPKLKILTNKCVISTAGCQTDTTALWKLLEARITFYEHEHGKTMSTPAIAQMLMNILYSRRMFPYYTFNMLSGIDEEGNGCVYGYDAIGSYQKIHAGAQGSGQSLIQPLLDSQRSFKNQIWVPEEDLSLEYAKTLVKDGFQSAGERDIYTGDTVQIMVITKDGIAVEEMALKKD